MFDAVKRKMDMSRAGWVDWELFYMEELRVNGPIPANSHLDGFKLEMGLVRQKGSPVQTLQCSGHFRLNHW